MSDAVIQLPPDGTGKLLDCVNLTVAGNSVYREKQVIADPVSNNYLSVDSSGRITVVVAGGSGSNPAAGLTGSAVPGSADYLGINIAGNLVGITGFSLASTKAAAIAIVDGSGNQITSFGGGTQFADNSASGATPTGTLSMGWDSANSKVRALKVDASQNLNVNLAANSFGTLTVSGSVSVSNFPVTQPVSGTVTVAQATAASLNATVVFPSAQHVIIDSATLGTVTVSGTVTANAGSNLNTSALALDTSVQSPLVAGGGTSAPTKVQMVGGKTNDGTPQYDIMPLGAAGRSVIIEGFAGGTAIPISGTVAVTNFANPLPVSQSGTWSVRTQDGSGNVLTSTGSALDVNLKTSSITLNVAGTVTANQGGAPWSQNLTQVGGASFSLGQQLAAASLPIVLTAAQLTTLTPLTTVAVTQSTSPWVANVSQFGGVNISTGTGTSGAGIPRVTVSNDSNVLATQSGNWTTRVVGNAGAIFDGATAAAVPANVIYVGANKSGNLVGLTTDASGNLNINLAAGSISGGNAAASPTGSAVPASADYTGFNVAGNLVGVSSSNPLPITDSTIAAILSNNAIPISIQQITPGTTNGIVVNGVASVLDMSDGPVAPGYLASQSSLIGARIINTAQQAALNQDTNGNLLVNPPAQNTISDTLQSMLAQLKLLNINLASSMPSAYSDADTLLMDTFQTIA